MYDVPVSDPQPLQFERPEFQSGSGPSAIACASCKRPVLQSYYEVNGRVICSACLEQYQRSVEDGGASRLFKAFFGALPLALLGGAVWWVVREYLNLQLGIISVAIGYYVGLFVRRASGHRGGAAYQLIAVVVTYIGICSNFVPGLVQRWPGFTVSVDSVLTIAGYALAAPFFGAFSLIGYLIVGFGLFEAWKLNKRTEVAINGPFSVSPASNV